MGNPSDDQIREILKNYKRVTVLGLSPQPDRPSHDVAQYLIANGYEVEGVRPGGNREILGRPVYENLEQVPGSLEIIDVFRASDQIPEVVDEVIKRKAKVLWLQLGIRNQEAEERAREAGLIVLSDLCLKREHKRLMGHQ